MHATEGVPLPPDLIILPIPKNLNPEHDGERRAARSKALHKLCDDSFEAAYVDTPPAPHTQASRVSPWRRHQTRTAPLPTLIHSRYPGHFFFSCKLFGKPGDFLHVLITCPTFS
ncbi:hypothetical protein V5799_010713 [Amblyomma americanum]|uniref:Tick transposon n=1 Tax=Amblyomma americanum TaxID=6943 RepID=A0AAQ4EJA8_AMBAM